jgi:hypothetical protein
MVRTVISSRVIIAESTATLKRAPPDISERF